jgi:glycosyltransferase A (GT-A) superfamily protein (DUF2064 family)
VTADVYTGKHRREGALGALGAASAPGVPAQGKPAWSKAGHLLAAQIVVIAKEPYPGRVKTRLTPPFTPVEAAELAAASLSDTLAAVAGTTVARRVVALAGTPGRWLPPGFDVIGQRGAGLDERIAWALADARVTLPLPVVLIGMDTPQVTPDLLAAAAGPLVSRSADATFGMAEDGGFWLLGLREVDPDLILGRPDVPAGHRAEATGPARAGRPAHQDAARAHRRRHGPRGRTRRRRDAGIALRGLHGPASRPG